MIQCSADYLQLKYEIALH